MLIRNFNTGTSRPLRRASERCKWTHGSLHDPSDSRIRSFHVFRRATRVSVGIAPYTLNTRRPYSGDDGSYSIDGKYLEAHVSCYAENKHVLTFSISSVLEVLSLLARLVYILSSEPSWLG